MTQWMLIISFNPLKIPKILLLLFPCHIQAELGAERYTCPRAAIREAAGRGAEQNHMPAKKNLTAVLPILGRDDQPGRGQVLA